MARRPGSGSKKPPRNINPLSSRLPTPPLQDQQGPPEKRPQRATMSEIPEGERYDFGNPEPASRDQLLLALSKLDPMQQELMIARRLASFQIGEDRVPVNIPRMVRGPWAHALRQLGIFCIPELATHKVVDTQADGPMANHMGAAVESIEEMDWLAYVREQNPKMASLIESAESPHERAKLMQHIAKTLPVDVRLRLEKLMATDPAFLEPK